MGVAQVHARHDPIGTRKLPGQGICDFFGPARRTKDNLCCIHTAHLFLFAGHPRPIALGRKKGGHIIT